MFLFRLHYYLQMLASNFFLSGTLISSTINDAMNLDPSTAIGCFKAMPPTPNKQISLHL